MNSQTDSLARGIVESASGGTVVLSIPGTSYQLHLESPGSDSTLNDAVGKRVRGRVEAQALRMHQARGGGRFIEPISGHPRIVQGTVEQIDAANRRVLVDVAVPMWVTLQDGQIAEQFAVGELVNFYVRSGATFTPVDGRT